ncbi:unnamed protein product [Parnassius mnemosyne]|uniref:Uncharacterized protein n=1 Tax=Parnassius mnemosyne TaxID=213953 RepID=A0AAV1L1Z8_9NEOP
MPKTIKSDARNIILKVFNFCEQEARGQAPIMPFNQVYKRVSAATDVSQGFISKIVKEQKNRINHRNANYNAR